MLTQTVHKLDTNNIFGNADVCFGKPEPLNISQFAFRRYRALRRAYKGRMTRRIIAMMIRRKVRRRRRKTKMDSKNVAKNLQKCSENKKTRLKFEEILSEISENRFLDRFRSKMAPRIASERLQRGFRS